MKIIMILIMSVMPAFAITAVWDKEDNQAAWSYTFSWGPSTGVHTSGTAELLRSACVTGIATDGDPYDCKLVVANTPFTIGTPYFAVVQGWIYAADGITKLISPKSNEVQFILRPDGSTGGVVPKAPRGLGVYTVAP